LLVDKHIPQKRYMLSVVDFPMIILSIGVVILALKKWKELKLIILSAIYFTACISGVNTDPDFQILSRDLKIIQTIYLSG